MVARRTCPNPPFPSRLMELNWLLLRMFLVCVYKLLYNMDLTFIIIKISAEAHLLSTKAKRHGDEEISEMEEWVKRFQGKLYAGKIGVGKIIDKIWKGESYLDRGRHCWSYNNWRKYIFL